jgi:hypothetical protein
MQTISCALLTIAAACEVGFNPMGISGGVPESQSTPDFKGSVQGDQGRIE